LLERAEKKVAALAFAIKNKLSMILARRCVVSLTGWGSLDGCSEVSSCCLTSQHHCPKKLAGQRSVKMVALLLRLVVVRTGQG